MKKEMIYEVGDSYGEIDFFENLEDARREFESRTTKGTYLNRLEKVFNPYWNEYAWEAVECLDYKRF